MQKRCLGLGVFVCLLSQSAMAQSFVQWNDGGVPCLNSTLTTLTGTFPGGTVTATSTGTGADLKLGEEYYTVNLNGASASEIFGSYGPGDLPPSKSLTFTFSTPVTINSLNMHELNRGPGGWNDMLQFSGVTFSSVITGAGVTADVSGTTAVPLSTGTAAEFANWFNSTAMVTSFSVDFPITDGLTTAYIGYSLEVTAEPNSIEDSPFFNGAHALQKQPVRIFDLMGRPAQYQPNTLLIYLYSDGSSEKIFVIE